MTTSRRQFLAGTAVAAGAGLLAGCSRTVDTALKADPVRAGSLADIDHIVLLMQENRSFDHYFGTMSSVRGFDDMPAGLTRDLRPFPLTAELGDHADVLFDPDHSWAVQHASWDHGRMDGWLRAHLPVDGPSHAPLIMGHYTRADLPAHFALADAFTVCDHYFSSAMGPTAPNRMYWMSATIDPDGHRGGPITAHSHRTPLFSLRWQTFPEVLTEAGISWKVYNARGPASRSELSGMLKYFRGYADPFSENYQRGIAPGLADFRADVAARRLPAVSWLVPTYAASEHPSHPPAVGAEAIMDVLDTLTSQPSVWERTLLIVSYDENGGFFDHVPPPCAPAGTPGEFLAEPARHGAGNDASIGLGFRVPALLISPHTRGGRVFSDVSDHTSQLKLIAKRFGLPVPNLSAWRDRTVSDLTAAIGPVTAPAASAAPLQALQASPTVAANAREAADDLAATMDRHAGFPGVGPITATRPRQESLPRRVRIPSGRS